jgi:hypothetical protein
LRSQWRRKTKIGGFYTRISGLESKSYPLYPSSRETSPNSGFNISILIPTAPWRETSPPGEPNKLFIIDWEFAQFGHRSYDLGQIVGDFYERKVFDNSEVGMPTMEGIISGYGELSDDMAFRTAIYVGVHLITWYTRRPKKNPKFVAPEVIVAGLKVGRDFILKGLERDRDFFQRSALASLFTAK